MSRQSYDLLMRESKSGCRYCKGCTSANASASERMHKVGNFLVQQRPLPDLPSIHPALSQAPKQEVDR